MTSSTSVDKDDEGHTTRSTTYNSPLVVEYEVDGRKHYSNTRRFGQLAGSSEQWAQDIAERFPTGAKIQVAYSPADPDLVQYLEDRETLKPILVDPKGQGRITADAQKSYK